MTQRSSAQSLPPAWEQLRSWVAVVEAGSVSAAARQLGVSQAGVSQHIRQLEVDYDTALLDRATRPAKPTAAGHRLHEQAVELLARADQMAESVRSLSRAKRPLVRLGCVDSFAATVGPQLVRGLLGRLHRVRLTSGLSPDLNQLFLNRQLDLLVTTGEPAPDAALERVTLLSEDYVVALPLGVTPAAHSSLQALSRDLPFMHYSARSLIGSQIDNYLRGCDPDIERAYEFDATDPLLSLVREGLGFALTTPLCLWQSRHHAERVQVLPLSAFARGGQPYAPLRRHFQMVHRRGELGRLPLEVAELVKVATRDLQREIAQVLSIDPGHLVPGR